MTKILLAFLLIVALVGTGCKLDSSNDGGGGSGVTLAKYSVFAWNDLGMHCLNPTYDTLVILPPYNNLWVQVVKRGNPPQIMTAGIEVSYSLVNNSYSSEKGNYAQFWTRGRPVPGSLRHRHPASG